MKKKALVILSSLLITMVISTFSNNVNAEEIKNESSNVTITDDENNNVQKISAGKMINYNNVTYIVENGSLTVYGVSNLNVKNINIPSIVNGYKVTKIDKAAFFKLNKLESVSIPETIEEISKGAFGECTKLTNVNISYGVKRIAAGAFAGCESIKEIYIPDSVVSIGKGAFAQCTKLNKITICNKNIFIGKAAFYNYEESFYNSMKDKLGELMNSQESDIDISQYEKYRLSNNNRVIYGFNNSTANNYALQENFKFKANNVSVVTSTHVQSIGWQKEVQSGETSGTQGRALRLEGIKMRIIGDNDLGISYSTQIQKIGWQEAKNNWNLSGTTGKSLRLEAIKINLTGKNKDKYDVYYRVHAQKYGWLGWAKNGEAAGTKGMALRLEAINVVIVNKAANAPGSTANAFHEAPPELNYKTHVQSYGWQKFVSNGAISGTMGKAKRLEGIEICFKDPHIDGGIEYSTHVQKIGWQDYVSNGNLSGTYGKGLRLEAISIRLTGNVAKKYDVYYRVHAQKYGWLDWAKNGDRAGTSGKGLRLEAIQIVLTEKGSKAPGSTSKPYIS